MSNLSEFMRRHLGLTLFLVLVGEVENKIVLNLPYFPHLFYTKSAILASSKGCFTLLTFTPED